MNTIIDTIGNTPLVKLNKLPHKYGIDCEIFAKCEYLNPGGSIKDRIAKRMIEDAEKSGKIVKTGFNHRFHPAIIKAKELLEQQAIGTILNIRSRYGHGGRPGMEQEWRCSKELCGGGELLDQVLR